MTAPALRWPVVADWREAWRWASARVALGIVAFGAAPVEAQAFILTMLHVPAARIPAVLGAVLIAARLFDANAPRFVVADWRDAPKWLSVQVGIVAVAWGAMPADWQHGLVGAGLQILGAAGTIAPETVVARMPAALGGLALVARLTAQQLRKEGGAP